MPRPAVDARAPLAAGAARVVAVLTTRALEALAVVATLASLVFFALRLLPGDPARLVLGDEASPADLARVRATLHLDEPLWTQYGRFLRGLATLDLGDSFRRPGTSAMAQVGHALIPTSELALVAVTVGALSGVAAAILASGPWLPVRGRRWIEQGLVAVAAAPLVAFAPLLTWALAARLRLIPLPGDPDAGLSGLLFAGVLLAIPLGAHVGRIARAALAEVVGPIVTVVATQLGALLGGAVVLERMFERRGLGTLILEAYFARDLPVLEGAVVASGLLFVAAQALGTLVHLAVDPRARAGR